MQITNNVLNLFQWIRNDANNILILNYLLIVYVLSLTLSYHLDRVVIGVILILFLFNENIIQRLLQAIKNKIVQAFLLFFTVVLLWIIGATDYSLAFHHLKSYRYFLYPLIFVAIIREDFVPKIIFTFLMAMMLNVIWSYMIIFDLASSPFQMMENLPLLVKSDHGFFTLICLGYALYRLINKNDNIKLKLLFSILFLLESINIFYTGSKTAMLLYVVMLSITFLFSLREKLIKALIYISLILTTVLMLTFLFIPSLSNTVNNIFSDIKSAVENNNYNGTVSARIGMFKYSLPVIQENFVFGVGTSDYIESFKTTIRNAIDENPAINSNNEFEEILNIFADGLKRPSLHNDYLMVIVQFGLIGLLFFLNIFYQIYKYKHYERDEHKFLSILLTTILLIFISSGWGFLEGNLGRFYVFSISILLYQTGKNHSWVLRPNSH